METTMMKLIHKEMDNKIINVVGVVIFILLIVFTLTNNYYGQTDVRSFTSVSKYFSGSYSADIRSSHSYLLGFLASGTVQFHQSFLGFKILNLFVLIFLVVSICYITGRREPLLLFVFSPIVWYMGSWINSIQISSLFFLWSYFFMKKSNEEDLWSVGISGLFFGLSVIFWHGILLLGFFFVLIFLIDKRLMEVIQFFLFFIIGLFPIFIFDQIVFGFPFHSLIKNVSGTIMNSLGHGLYSQGGFFNILNGIGFLLFLPLFWWKIYKPDFAKENFKTTLFLTICILIIFFMNPQIRYAFFLMPLILVNINMKGKRAWYLFYSAILIISIVIIPYYVYDNPNQQLEHDLNRLVQDYPNEVFVVGNHPDDYDILANAYWGNQVKEFVSIQDYRDEVDYEKSFVSTPEINARREIWFKAGMRKSSNDLTDYDSIKYGISFDDLELEGFEFVKRYGDLKLYEKEEERFFEFIGLTFEKIKLKEQKEDVKNNQK